jgi:transposase-like protein
MRHFRHLSGTEITEIVVAFNDGESQASLARRFGVDHSTINYHVAKYQEAYPEQGGIYAYLKVRTRRDCIHPSGRCTTCGEMWDMLARKERDQIAGLTKQLTEARRLLAAAGLVWNP